MRMPQPAETEARSPTRLAVPAVCQLSLSELLCSVAEKSRPIPTDGVPRLASRGTNDATPTRHRTQETQESPHAHQPHRAARGQHFAGLAIDHVEPGKHEKQDVVP